MIVRQMQPREFDPTVILFGRYFDEAAESIPSMTDEYDENAVIETIKTFASKWDHCWFNAYDNQRPVGFVAGYASECPWNKNIIDANIAFIYLIESHRNMDNFRELLTGFEGWARSIKAKTITAGDIGINPERTQKLFEHFDFKPGVWLSRSIA